MQHSENFKCHILLLSLLWKSQKQWWVNQWVDGQVEVYATKNLLQQAKDVFKFFYAENYKYMLKILVHLQNTKIVIPAKPSRLLFLLVQYGLRPKLETDRYTRKLSIMKHRPH